MVQQCLKVEDEHLQRSTQTDALVLAGLIFGGNTATTKVEGYDGTSWSTRPSLATGRYYGYGFGPMEHANLAALTSPGGHNPHNSSRRIYRGNRNSTAATLTTS